MHIRYPKIRRLGTKEVDGIFNWEVLIQEKIDWANCSAWIQDWVVFVWSRTQIVGDDKKLEWFNWAVQYIKSHKGINKFLKKHQDCRLYWEWLVQHTVRYSPEVYRRFWLYDIAVSWESEDDVVFMDPKLVADFAIEYGIDTPHIFYSWNSSDIQEGDIEKWTNEAVYWDKTEWIVVKNNSFINGFWRNCYWKNVLESFREENKIIFWWSSASNGVEEKWALKFCTPGRFMKILHKIEQQKGLDFCETMIGEMIGRMNYDILSEEFWSICKWVIDFNILKKYITDMTRTMCLQMLSGSEAFNLYLDKQWKK